MNHHLPEEETTLQAALHALGVLPEAEARTFEQHLAQGCKVCQAEVQAYHLLVEKLGFAAPAVEPPARVLDRLFKELRGQPSLQSCGRIDHAHLSFHHAEILSEQQQTLRRTVVALCANSSCSR